MKADIHLRDHLELCEGRHGEEMNRPETQDVGCLADPQQWRMKEK